MESDKYWEIMAAVVPVLALAFVLEVRYLRFDRMGPFARLYAALAHALTILILLASEAAALVHLQGVRQAHWAESFAACGCLAALSVILVTPTSRLLMIGLHGTSRTGYVTYWKYKKSLRALRRDIKDLGRERRKGKRMLNRTDAMIATYEAKERRIRGDDLQSIWYQESLRDAISKLQANRADFLHAQAAFSERAKKAERAVLKLERKLVKHTGSRTKKLQEALDKHMP